MNIVLLVGRICNDAEIKVVGDNHYVTQITLAVKRDFKNADGIYQTDFIPVTLWEGIAQLCCEHCRKGTMISLKARVVIKKRELEKITLNELELIGEKLAILHKPTREEEGKAEE